VGTGETLNEHILSHRWPLHNIRLATLESRAKEAIWHQNYQWLMGND
jgi:hypothetical protein